MAVSSSTTRMPGWRASASLVGRFRKTCVESWSVTEVRFIMKVYLGIVTRTTGGEAS
jgi:hypothetical protein